MVHPGHQAILDQAPAVEVGPKEHLGMPTWPLSTASRGLKRLALRILRHPAGIAPGAILTHAIARDVAGAGAGLASWTSPLSESLNLALPSSLW